MLDVHDAYIVSPIAAEDVRRWYGDFMDAIYANRAEILTGYFKSIGINQGAVSQWVELQNKVQPVEDFKCRPMALK